MSADMSVPPRDDRTAGTPQRTPPVAVTMGDPAGIGPDIALTSWLERSRLDLPAFLLYGDPQVLQARALALGARVPIATVAGPVDATTAFADGLPVMPVPMSGAGGSGDTAIVSAIELATAAVMAGEALALVTNPITKRSLSMAHLPYPGRRRAQGCADHRPHSIGGGGKGADTVSAARDHQDHRYGADPRLRHRAPAPGGDGAQSARR